LIRRKDTQPMNAELDFESLRQLVITTVHSDNFREATFGGVVRHDPACPWVRIALRAVDLRSERHLQFSYFEARKCITKNVRGSDIDVHLNAILAVGFARIHLATRSEEIDLQTTRKGKVLIGRRQADAGVQPASAHNRVKSGPFPEGHSDRVLEVMGIMTRAGQVRPTQRAKYTQIRELLKQLSHVLDEEWVHALGRPLEILDCGCGSSFLTLAVHHYLNDVLGFPAHILGVDVNEEVIRKSIERSRCLGAESLSEKVSGAFGIRPKSNVPTSEAGFQAPFRIDSESLRFACGRIDAVAARPDIVLALHACDTATDDALAQAVARQAHIVLSVPCCHHHLNDQLRAAGQADVLRPLLRHGILQQRTADLVTDAFRALALRIMGYRTEVVEFISPEHTARNLMIRAVRGVPIGAPALVHEYLEMRRFWGVTPYIETALGEPFLKYLL